MKKNIFILLCLTFVMDVFAADTTSNITIHNQSAGTTYEITGVYIQKLATGGTCSTLAGNTFTPAHGFAYGIFWKPTTLAPNGTFDLGANFLYQMMGQLLYQTYQNSGSNCTPGNGKCTAGTDDPNTNKWCIRLGFVKGSPILPTVAITASNDLVPLINSTQIKITCDDSASTCTANTAVTQNIP